MLAACAVIVGVSACGGTQLSADQMKDHEVAAGIDIPAQVVCHDSRCAVSASYDSHSRLEASFVALPVADWVDTDPDLKSVRAITLRIANARTNATAVFQCRLPHAAHPGLTGVWFVKRACVIRVVASY